MRNPVEIRQVDVGRGKAGKIRSSRGRDLARFPVFEPKPNDMLNATNGLRLRLRLNFVRDVTRLSVQASDRNKTEHAKD